MRHSGIPFTKSLKKVSAALLAGAILLSNIGEVTAYTVTTTGNTDFNTEKASFEKAKSPMYCNKSESISGKISSARKQDIYHYECQEGGYYAVYTTGSSDTVGAVYEEENGIFSTDYELRDWNDDAYTGGLNFNIVADLDKYEDYYVCVRCYGTKTGSYTLKIEPNEDLFSKRNYGVWKCEQAKSSALYLGVWTSKKVYLNKDQTLLYYWVLDPAIEVKAGNTTYTIKQLEQEFKSNNSTGYNLIVSALATALGLGQPSAVNITLAVLSFVLTESYSALTQGWTAYDMMQFLANTNNCGVSHNTSTGKWTVKKGLLAIKTTNINAPYLDPWSYSSYNPGSTQMKGEKWYKGKWSWDDKNGY